MANITVYMNSIVNALEYLKEKRKNIEELKEYNGAEFYVKIYRNHFSPHELKLIKLYDCYYSKKNNIEWSYNNKCNFYPREFNLLKELDMNDWKDMMTGYDGKKRVIFWGYVIPE